ncbi:nuclear transport factor 2 family protein [Sphingobium yanoikuyae]|uniref:Nuclear transport factor 2 family protein n=1 Tax=Sphingobium yanoikuyae TaxID=13690 RepID=A0AA42X2A6_SPHYA|nr:nuclear transport factor 2 family protein [Sphingobium yanoikuyae]MDH2134771.1 nuclear transport factor 2 family protein [Sphingobium yanoikuyae]MDH2152553.1 nuclear transport factor 2 family protein [Sphingobium yanoikuyae]MDH2170160.1 nuclear transport factor 2 family protein [Sphingobium yanoikuyae]
MSEAATLAAQTDRTAIVDLIYRYCRSVDRLDIALGHSIWHEDGWADYGADVYQGPGKGVIDLICAQHLHTLHHSHQISNIVIALNGDRAGSEAYCTASLRIEREGGVQQITVWNRYVDQWEKRAGRWGLVKRLTIRDFDEIRAVSEMQRHDRGRRDRADASYEVLGAIPKPWIPCCRGAR